jgi:basic membrane protein A
MKEQFYRGSIFLLVGLLLLMVPALALAQDPTAEPTEEATAEATAEATTEATEEATAEPTVEATAEATAEAAEPAAEDAGGVVCDSDVVVQADDWLSKIAEKAFGDVLTYPAIAEATNAKAAVDSSYATIEDVNVIEPGWKLCIPSATYAESVLGLGLETAEATPSAETIAIPAIEEGKTNVAFVYVGPIGDGGWTYAHNEGRKYLEAQLGDTVNTAYLESVPEGADAERVIRNLARQGFDVIFTTSFGYMDPTGVVAEEFPDTAFIHVTGQKKNETNFGNIMGSIEDMKYLAGMIAGAKAAEDGSNRVGIIAPFPIAEVIRLSNAAALGMRRTCPECTMDIRWIFTWFDPVKEREAAESMLDAGATVIITGADTPGPVQAAAERDLSGIAYDSENACFGLEANCLTVPYWNWGPVYTDIVQGVQEGTWQPEDFYGDATTGMLGLYGFMEGQEPYTSVPESVIPEVQELLGQMQAGEFTRFDIFTGPINDNQGNEVIPAGVSLTQSDLEGLSGEYMTAFEITGREPCTICMDYLVEGFDPTAEIPPLN